MRWSRSLGYVSSFGLVQNKTYFSYIALFLALLFPLPSDLWANPPLGNSTTSLGFISLVIAPKVVNVTESIKKEKTRRSIFKKKGKKISGKEKNLKKGMAIWSFVLGIFSLGLVIPTTLGIPFIVLLGLTSISSIVLGWMSLYRIKKNPEKYSGELLASAGLTMTGLALLLFGVGVWAYFNVAF